MYLQEILEVAVGLVFVWLVLALAAMQIQEWIATMLAKRSADLEKSIRELLSSEDLADKFYTHPLIASLYKEAKPGKKPRLPSYIPANKFATALFDIIVDAGTDASPVKKLFSDVETQLASLDDPAQRKLAGEDWNTILETMKQVAASGMGETAVDSLKQQVEAFAKAHPELQSAIDTGLPQLEAYYKQFQADQRAAGETGPETDLAIRQFRLGLLALNATNPKLKKTLSSLLKSSQAYAGKGEQAIANTRTTVENWFNDAMDRLSGAYKRYAQLMAFIIGFVLALLLNIDSITVAVSMWREPTLRQAIVAQADAYATQYADGLPASDGTVVTPANTVRDLQAQMTALTLPFGWFSDPVTYDPTIPCNLSQPSEIDEAGNQTRIMGIKMGDVCYPVINTPPANWDHWLDWLSKLLGLVISGMAAAQGAPFWFDMLRKLINIRGSGSNPAEAKPKG